MVFTRTTRVKTSAGGWIDGTTVAGTPQTVRVVAQSPGRRVTADGAVVIPKYVVIGMPDADMKKGDVFTWEGDVYRIFDVNNTPAWAKRGEAIEHGSPTS